MRRADRLFQIVQKLRSGKLTTARDLAEWLEVSERTIYRDIADLMKSGLPIDGEAGLGYLMRDGYDLPPLMFTAEEIVALITGARLVQAWGGREMAKGAETALDKITTALPEGLRRRADAVSVHAIRRPDMSDITRQHIDEIERALTQTRILRLQYRDKSGRSSQRDVRPIGLWYWGMVWTLVAWCELRAAFRMFRVDRIDAMETGAPYTPEPGQSLQDFYASEIDDPDRPAQSVIL